MIIDTSALIAILYREPEAESFVKLIHEAETHPSDERRKLCRTIHGGRTATRP